MEIRVVITIMDIVQIAVNGSFFLRQRNAGARTVKLYGTTFFIRKNSFYRPLSLRLSVP